MCIVIDGSSDVCRGRNYPNVYFGDCKVCQYDECNGEGIASGNLIIRLRFDLALLLFVAFLAPHL